MQILYLWKHEMSCRPEGLDVHFKYLMLTLLEGCKNVGVAETVQMDELL